MVRALAERAKRKSPSARRAAQVSVAQSNQRSATNQALEVRAFERKDGRKEERKETNRAANELWREWQQRQQQKVLPLNTTRD